jgi:hypothetical protein
MANTKHDGQCEARGANAFIECHCSARREESKRHPSNVYFDRPIIKGKREYAKQAALDPRRCAECGMINRHRSNCPEA